MHTSPALRSLYNYKLVSYSRIIPAQIGYSLCSVQEIEVCTIAVFVDFIWVGAPLIVSCVGAQVGHHHHDRRATGEGVSVGM
jgi:hypothetical protein